MKLKISLTDIAATGNWNSLPDKIGTSLKRRSNVKSSLDEALEELSRPNQDILWNSAFLFCSELLLKHSQPTTDVDSNLDNEIRTFSAIMKLIDANCRVLDSNKNSYMPEKLLEFIIFLGNIVHNLKTVIQKVVMEICTDWIAAKREGYKDVIPNTLKVAIADSLKNKAKKTSVKQVWNLKTGLQTILLESEPEVTSMLINCTSSSLYLSCEEGMKFVSLLLCINDLTARVHEHIKSALPQMTKTESTSLGEGYFRAWKMSEPNMKQKIEEDCLQDLMYAAVHITPQTNSSENLFCFLGYIHNQKKHLPTAAVIYRLYEPFIWRSLKVANSRVRRNAFRLLCDAFPLTENKSKEEEEDLRNRQYQIFLTFLVDPCHIVRIKTMQGTFSVLAQYWRLIPSSVIQQLFQILIGKLLVDASSNMVRAEVLKGLTLLLDCAEAVPFVTSILPKTAESFEDVDGTVRQTFIKLLLKVKTTKYLKYWTIVPMDHLLLRLGADSVTRGSIVCLIQNSFLPISGSEKEWMQRAISMIEIDRTAARHFYQIACKQMDLEAVTKFIICIWRTLYRYIQLMNTRQESQDNMSNSLSESSTNIEEERQPTRRQKKKTAILPKNNKENIGPSKGTASCNTNVVFESSKGDDESSQLPLQNLEVTGGLIDIIVITWTVNSGRLNHADNFKFLDALRSRISKSFTAVWSFFKETSLASGLLYLGSFLPQSYMPTMVGLCMAKLKSVESIVEPSEEMNLYLVALCNWNRVDDILELVSDWLTGTFKTLDTSDKPTKKARKVQFAQTSPPKPLIGLHFIRLLLKHRLNRLCLLEKNRSLFHAFFVKMSTIVEIIEKRLVKESELSQSCSDEFILVCLTDYFCIASLLNDSSVTEDALSKTLSKNKTIRTVDSCNASEVFVNFMDIIERVLLHDDRPTKVISPFETQCIVAFIEASSNLMAIGASNSDFVYTLLKFLSKIIPRYHNHQGFVKALFIGISEANAHLHFYESDHLLSRTSILAVMGCTIKQISSMECRNLSSDTITSFSKTIQPLLQSLLKTSIDLVEGSISMILYSALNTIQQEFESIILIEKFDTVFDFNNICVHFLDAAFSIVPINVLKVFEYNFEKEKLDRFEIFAALSIFNILNVQGKVKASGVKSLLAKVEQNFENAKSCEENEVWIEKMQKLIEEIRN